LSIALLYLLPWTEHITLTLSQPRTPSKSPSAERTATVHKIVQRWYQSQHAQPHTTTTRLLLTAQGSALWTGQHFGQHRNTAFFFGFLVYIA
jgi:hypothetical protein